MYKIFLILVCLYLKLSTINYIFAMANINFTWKKNKHKPSQSKSYFNWLQHHVN